MAVRQYEAVQAKYVYQDSGIFDKDADRGYAFTSSFRDGYGTIDIRFADDLRDKKFQMWINLSYQSLNVNRYRQKIATILVVIHGLYLLIVVYQFGLSKPFRKEYRFTFGILLALCVCYMFGITRILVNNGSVSFIEIAETILFLVVYVCWLIYDYSSKKSSLNGYHNYWMFFDFCAIFILVLSFYHPIEIPFIRDIYGIYENIHAKDIAVATAVIGWFIIFTVKKIGYRKHYPKHYQNYLDCTELDGVPLAKIDQVADVFKNKKELKILDFGCGNGRRIREFLIFADMKDVRIEMHDAAKRWKQFYVMRERSELVKLAEAKWTKFFFWNIRKYDIVYASNVLYTNHLRKKVLSSFSEKGFYGKLGSVIIWILRRIPFKWIPILRIKWKPAESPILVIRSYASNSFFFNLDFRLERESAYNWINHMNEELEKYRLEEVTNVKIPQITKWSAQGFQIEQSHEERKNTLAAAIAIIQNNETAKGFARELIDTSSDNGVLRNDEIIYVIKRA
ncbi:MAG: hypothetical protein NT002_12460 [candidate division Zixibacteria bacterium]|nr:hypothetical protein [candidate division Zixibacteria bacterium]